MDNCAHESVSCLIEFIAAFAERHELSHVDAYRYLSRYDAIKAVREAYSAGNVAPMEALVESMTAHCKERGGHL